MNHDARLTARKIARAIDLISPLVYRRRAPLEPLTLRLLGSSADDPLSAAATDGLWQPVPPNTYWGRADLNFLLRGVFTVPNDFDHDVPVVLVLPLGDAGDFSHPEALAYIDGQPWAAADRHHQELPLPDRCRDGRDHDLLLHGWTGLLGHTAAGPGRKLFMGECAVAQIDLPTRRFLALARTALAAAELLSRDEPARDRLFNALDEAYRLLDLREPFGNNFYTGVAAALAALEAGVTAAGLPLDADIIAAGHAHIDVAWLWTLDQTRRKAGRTFATTLRLMEHFPAYHFSQSQPQLYDFIKQDYPTLFEQIRRRVAEGRWEPLGGMWVEADCNISGPESLARQFLLGRRFFREQFGPEAESPVLWLPDVFGYAWNLPQLIRQAGLEYFFTIKIGWNRTNKLPYDSFWWQGLDGTRVLTHFSTTPEAPWGDEPPNLQATATYNADLTAFAARGTWSKLQHKESQRVMLMSYGYGDGGGGPTREMNENAAVLRSFPALPRVTQGRVIDFFRRLEAESGDRLPVWNSELYLEIHRGTYTTQARNKRANRQSEFLLHDAEFLAAWAATLDPAFIYPHEALREAWTLVCLNQFHDIIPGSSIGAVYEESLHQYAQVRALGEAVRDAALDVVAAAAGGDVVVVNPTSFARDDYVLLPGGLSPGKCLRPADVAAVSLPAQSVEGGLLIDVGSLPPHSVTALVVTNEEHEHAAGEDNALVVDEHTLENACLRVEFDAAGDIVRIYDKLHGREVLPPGAVANEWQAFEDRPVDWDAWDIDSYYEDKRYSAEPATSVRVIERGPLRATLLTERRILNSRYTQRVSLCANRSQIDFDAWIDWRERHILLKTAFPVDVLAPTATYEIQWGNVQRPTHRNTSWDWARFETCAQKWVDLSEGDYGAALLNDSKYGHDIRDHVMRLTLLRAPTMPDPEAEQGEHRFAYSLFIHGPAAAHDIAARAYALNDPLLVARSAAARPSSNILERSFVAVDSPHVIIETVKAAEDGRGIIVRLYESDRTRGPVELQCGFQVAAAWESNLLEEDSAALPVDGYKVRLTVRPFQIVTVRLLPANYLELRAARGSGEKLSAILSNAPDVEPEERDRL